MNILYTKSLKNREFDKEGPQNFCSERATIAERQGASENRNYEAADTDKQSSGLFVREAGEQSELARRDPTQSKIDFSSFLCIHLQDTSIYDQLLLEEQLLREDNRNFCLINSGSTPAIVMGISGKADALVHLDQLPDSIPILRRFSGGGTVIVDENTVFVTFICNKTDHEFPAYPEPILRWAESVLAPVTKGLKLRENDFVIDEKKCGGNALYIKKDRWLVHTSFLWDYDPARMNLLKYPAKTPKYREGRTHEEFVCSLSDHLPSKEIWIVDLKKSLASRLGAKEIFVEDLSIKMSHYGTSIVDPLEKAATGGA